MDCPGCATMLEMDFEDVGIKCKCSYVKGKMEIEGKHDFAKVESVIKKSGYYISHVE